MNDMLILDENATEVIKKKIFRRYKIIISSIYKIKHGADRGVYSFISSAGLQYVLKLYPEIYTYKDIQQELTILGFLKNCSTLSKSLSSYIQDSEGRCINIHNMKYYTIETKLDGTHPKRLTKSIIHKILSLLYMISKRCEKLDNKQFYNRSINNYLDQQVAFFGKMVLNSIIKEDELRNIINLVHDIKRTLPTRNVYSVIHGDAHKENILINKDNIFLLDYDFLYAPKEFDLASMLLECFDIESFDCRTASNIIESYNTIYSKNNKIYSFDLTNIILYAAITNIPYLTMHIKNTSNKRKEFLRQYKKLKYIKKEALLLF